MIFVTYASNFSDLIIIESNISKNFERVVVCISFEMDLNILENISSIIVMLNKNESFNDCSRYASEIGMKYQTFLILKDFKTFKFNHIKSLKFVTDDYYDFNKDFLILKKNVANGIRNIKIELTNNYLSSELNCINLKNTLLKLKWHTNDLVHETCHDMEEKTLWIPDFHDGPRVDITSTLAYLGHHTILAGHKYYKSPYPEALRLGKIIKRFSNLIKTHQSIKDKRIAKNIIKQNFYFYKDDPDFINVDGVICSFSSSMCEAFIPLNQTIIFNPAKMYNLNRCKKIQWKKLNENIEILNKMNKLILAGTSKYDIEYQYHFTGIKGFRLYGYGGFYSKDVVFNPTKKEILIGPGNSLGLNGKELYKSLVDYSKIHAPEFDFKLIRNVYKRYELNQLANHRAIVLLPYATQCYSVIDFYISNIPLFAPTPDFLYRNNLLNDRTLYHYCGRHTELIESHTNSYHAFDPNSENKSDFLYWVKYADYYEWPFVNYFDSWSDLVEKLKTANFKDISEKMKSFNVIREADLLNNWCTILKRIKKSKIPDSYKEALEYFNVTYFQN